MPLFVLHLLFVLLHLSWALDDANNIHSITNAEIIAKPGCASECGDLRVPYPFGIYAEGHKCSINPSFDITCNYSTNPPKALLRILDAEVYNINDTEIRISNLLAYTCYSSGEVLNHSTVGLDLVGTPYMYSDANVLTVVGCDDIAYIYNSPDRNASPKGCITTCLNTDQVPKNTCSGSGCCQVSVNIQQYFDVSLTSFHNHTNVSSSNDCGYAFLGEQSRFKFQGTSDLNDSTFESRTMADVPLVLDWVIANTSCNEAAGNPNSYTCKHANSKCVDRIGSGGYRCSCIEGFEGNPYLSPGCTDIDECKNPQENVCKQICNNTPGSYTSSCKDGYILVGNDCIYQGSKSQLSKFILGMGFACLSIIILMNWLYCIMRKRKHMKLKEKFFQQNGGLLLKQHSMAEGGTIESTKHFTDEELKKATNNYAADRVLGQGGYGVVYKGILPDDRVVAIKKSKVMDKSQIEQFINEVVILTQVNHRNVVKLLGCCLECEVPLLVYEFVSNGTLFHHVHNITGGMSWLSLENRLRIAAESSSALAYLHSAASIPIMHRDVKLANILLDDHHVAKISDFGASRLIPMDQTQVTTLVQGTIGYLDPEYFHTGQLTNKSDVYSFGVVLAELLTGRKPICMDNPERERNLATHFITSLKEDRLFQILDPRVLREGTVDQFQKAGELVKRCLSLNGEKRPTMKEVAMEIESLRKFTKHPSDDQHDNEETTSLSNAHSYKIQHSDLYGIQLSPYDGTHSEQYSSSSVSLMHQPTSPR